MLVLNGRLKLCKKIFVICIFLFIAYFTIPNLVTYHSSGSESSWRAGLSMASIRNMQFGKDIVFTYGPLGFLNVPCFTEYNTWLISAFFVLFLRLLLLVLIFILIKKYQLNILDYLVLAVVLYFALQRVKNEYLLYFIILSLVYLIITNDRFKKHQLLLCFPICFFMAVLSLFKFTGFFGSVYLLVFLSIYFAYNKKYKSILLAAGIYSSSIILLLFLAGQKIVNFPLFLLSGYKMSSGYNSGMSISGPDGELLIGMLVIGLIFFIVLDSFLKKNKDLILFVLINAAYIFLSFKHGFVRQDAHVYIFFTNMLLVLLITAFALKSESRVILQHSSFILMVVLIGLIFSHYKAVLIPKVKRGYDNIYSAVSLIKASDDERAQRINRNKDRIKKSYSLDDMTVNYISDKSMDVLQKEISIAYAYDFNWCPRPVFQTYGAYTHELDVLNARHFEGDDSPEVLLYDLGTIDFRYHLFDTPATFRTILDNYKSVLIDKGFLLLEKRDTPYLSIVEEISTIDVNIGETINIPKSEDGFVFARIYMDYSLLGKFANILYKTPYMIIVLKSEEKEYEHRFIISTAENGIFLSQYIGSIEEFEQIWDNKPVNNLDSFTIKTGHESFFNTNIQVKFFQVKPAKSFVVETNDKK